MPYYEKPICPECGEELIEGAGITVEGWTLEHRPEDDDPGDPGRNYEVVKSRESEWEPEVNADGLAEVNCTNGHHWLTPCRHTAPSRAALMKFAESIADMVAENEIDGGIPEEWTYENAMAELNAIIRDARSLLAGPEDICPPLAQRKMLEKWPTAEPLRPVRFVMAGDQGPYPGFANGTTWNGFDNIWVKPHVHKQIVADLVEQTPNSDPIEALGGLHEIEEGPPGLISLAYGFCTWIVHNECEHCGGDGTVPTDCGNIDCGECDGEGVRP